MFLTQRQLCVVHYHPYTRLELELHQILVQRAYNHIGHLLNTHKMAFLHLKSSGFFYVQTNV